MSNKRWTKEEDDIVKQYYPLYGYKKVSDELYFHLSSNRSRKSINRRAARLHIAYSYDYHDDWILDNYINYETHTKMWNAYKNIFNSDISYSFFVEHLHSLGIRRKLTKEIVNEISSSYVRHGAKQFQEELINRFGIYKKETAIHTLMHVRGIKVSDSAFRSIMSEARNLPDGTIRFSKHNKRKLYARIKINGNWISYGSYVCDNNDKDYIAIPLDRDQTNLNPENWILIPKQYSIYMTQSGLWSNIPEVTKVGITWCELAYALKSQGVDVEELINNIEGESNE